MEIHLAIIDYLYLLNPSSSARISSLPGCLVNTTGFTDCLTTFANNSEWPPTTDEHHRAVLQAYYCDGGFHKFYARPAVGTAAAPMKIREHQDKIEKNSTRGVWGVALPML
jgi:hypothetical protein